MMDDELHAPDLWVVHRSMYEAAESMRFFLDEELAAQYVRRFNRAHYPGAAKVLPARFTRELSCIDEKIWFCVSYHAGSSMEWRVEPHLDAIGPGPDHLKISYDRKNNVQVEVWVSAADRSDALKRGTPLIKQRLAELRGDETPPPPPPRRARVNWQIPHPLPPRPAYTINATLGDYTRDARGIERAVAVEPAAVPAGGGDAEWWESILAEARMQLERVRDEANIAYGQANAERTRVMVDWLHPVPPFPPEALDEE